jgi:hypothetical protein
MGGADSPNVPYGTLWITLCALDLVVTDSNLFVTFCPTWCPSSETFWLHVMKKAD